MGKAHVYRRSHINTDEIIPARYLNTDDEAVMAKHCMEDIDPEFLKKVHPGDVIVAGDDFGCGSSREHAVWAIRGAGVTAVVAGSFARIFYRNAINGGFLVVELPGVSEKVNDGDELEIDARNGVLFNKTQGQKHKFIPLPDFALEIIEAGGLLKQLHNKANR
jgi:3-isopropylmalate/(R)-2-methylmalate dehydratase small subunit